MWTGDSGNVASPYEPRNGGDKLADAFRWNGEHLRYVSYPCEHVYVYEPYSHCKFVSLEYVSCATDRARVVTLDHDTLAAISTLLVKWKPSTFTSVE